MSLIHRLAELRESEERGILFTAIDGEGAGTKVLVLESGERIGDGPRRGGRRSSTSSSGAGATRSLTLDDGSKVFAEWYGPPPRLFVYGAVDTAEAMCRAREASRLARDRRRRPREVRDAASGSRRRTSSSSSGRRRRSRRCSPTTRPRSSSSTHDDKFDEPALIGALETDAFYIGALGSRRNQERRRERLLEAGVPEEALDRINGPCGLDIGADTQEETALSIMSEILAVRAQREGGFLKDAKKRIHAEVE